MRSDALPTGRRFVLAATMAFALGWARASASSTDLTEAWINRVDAGERSSLEAELEREVSAHPGDGQARYQLARVAARGSDAALREAGRLAGAQAPEYRLIAQAEFALAQGDPMRARSFAAQYAEAYPQGELRDRAQLRMAQSELATQRIAEAEARFDWLSRNAEQPWKGFGLYGQAHAALYRGDTVEAIRLFRQTSRLARHEASAPAMLYLGSLYQARGESSESFRFLALYREAYPEGMLPVVEETPGADPAEAEAAFVYAVQVGVFGERSNAEAQAAKFRALQYTVTLKPKTIGDKRYTSVWVGRFASREKAQNVRLELERKFDETYRVVVFE